MAISMRHTKMKAEEVALLAGEVTKPTWQSKNEGIHERVSFEDTIWGFDLAGGSYYRTPLRVTFVKPDSRAEMANVKPGDLLLRINDIDTSTLTIQEAHDLIVESGINIKLHVTGPDDIHDSYYYYEDPPVEETVIEDLKIIEERLKKQQEYNLKSAHHLKLKWPWVSKKFLIYRESNCFMVPSKYESTRRDKYPELPHVRLQDVIVFDKVHDYVQTTKSKNKDNGKKQDSTEDKEEVSLPEEEEEITEGNNANDNQSIDGDKDLSSEIDVDDNEEEEVSEATVEEQETDDGKEPSDKMDFNNNSLEEEKENLDNETEQNDQINETDEKMNGELINDADKDNDTVNELLNNGDMTKVEEDKIINGVLNGDD